MIKTFSVRFAMVLGAALVLAPSSYAQAQSRTLASNDRITPIASAGCSGASWARYRSANGIDYPVVTKIDGNSPADASGLKEGDIILAVNGRDARELDTWFVAAPGEMVRVKVQRAGKERELEVKAGRVQEQAPEKGEIDCVR